MDAAEQMDREAIENDPAVIFALDRNYRFLLCNAAWDRFATENGGEHLLRAAVLGRSVFDYISGDAVDHYREVFRTTLQNDTIWQREYECSSPTVYRRFCMGIYPIHGELLIVNSLVIEEPHPAPADRPQAPADPPLEAQYRNRHGIVVMCSNCRRAKLAGTEERWDWVPGFVSSPPLMVSHGFCPPCYEYYFSRIG